MTWSPRIWSRRRLGFRRRSRALRFPLSAATECPPGSEAELASAPAPILRAASSRFSTAWLGPCLPEPGSDRRTRSRGDRKDIGQGRRARERAHSRHSGARFRAGRFWRNRCGETARRESKPSRAPASSKIAVAPSPPAQREPAGRALAAARPATVLLQPRVTVAERAPVAARARDAGPRARHPRDHRPHRGPRDDARAAAAAPAFGGNGGDEPGRVPQTSVASG